MKRVTDSVKMIVPMMLFVMVKVAFAQVGNFEDDLSDAVFGMFQNYFKPAVQICLFLWAAWEVIQGLIGRDKQTSWIQVIMIIVAIAVLEVLPAFWSTISGHEFS